MMSNTEQQFEKVLADVQWWLYEDVEKVIYIKGQPDIDVSTPESFIDFLGKHYS